MSLRASRRSMGRTTPADHRNPATTSTTVPIIRPAGGHDMRLTRRGWAVLTILVMLLGAVAGTLITMGDSPCGYAVTTVECQ